MVKMDSKWSLPIQWMSSRAVVHIAVVHIAHVPTVRTGNEFAGRRLATSASQN